MNLRLVNIDPKRSAAAAVIYNYGQEKYEEGFYSGVIYSALGFIFLLCMRELVRYRSS